MENAGCARYASGPPRGSPERDTSSLWARWNGSARVSILYDQGLDPIRPGFRSYTTRVSILYFVLWILARWAYSSTLPYCLYLCNYFCNYVHISIWHQRETTERKTGNQEPNPSEAGPKPAYVFRLWRWVVRAVRNVSFPKVPNSFFCAITDSGQA